MGGFPDSMGTETFLSHKDGRGVQTLKNVLTSVGNREISTAKARLDMSN